VHRRRHGHRHVRRPRLIPSFRHTYRMRAATAARFVWQAPPGAGRNPRVSAGMVRSDGRLSENGGNKWTAASRTVLGRAARVSSSAAQPGRASGLPAGGKSGMSPGLLRASGSFGFSRHAGESSGGAGVSMRLGRPGGRARASPAAGFRLGLERLEQAQRAPELGQRRAAIAQQRVERAAAIAVADQGKGRGCRHDRHGARTARPRSARCARAAKRSARSGPPKRPAARRPAPGPGTSWGRWRRCAGWRRRRQG
jgi:hypothetical protein